MLVLRIITISLSRWFGYRLTYFDWIGQSNPNHINFAISSRDPVHAGLVYKLSEFSACAMRPHSFNTENGAIIHSKQVMENTKKRAKTNGECGATPCGPLFLYIVNHDTVSVLDNTLTNGTLFTVTKQSTELANCTNRLNTSSKIDMSLSKNYRRLLHGYDEKMVMNNV